MIRTEITAQFEAPWRVTGSQIIIPLPHEGEAATERYKIPDERWEEFCLELYKSAEPIRNLRFDYEIVSHLVSIRDIRDQAAMLPAGLMPGVPPPDSKNPHFGFWTVIAYLFVLSGLMLPLWPVLIRLHLL